MGGPIAPPPTIVTANGSRIIISGTPVAGQVPTATGPNAAVWAPGGGASSPIWVHELSQDLTASDGSYAAFLTQTWADSYMIYGDSSGEISGATAPMVLLLDPLIDPLAGGSIVSFTLKYDVAWTTDPGRVVANMNPFFSVVPVIPGGASSPFDIYGNQFGVWIAHGELSMPPQRFDAGPSTGFEAGLLWENAARANGPTPPPVYGSTLRITATKWAHCPYRAGWND